MPRTVKSMERRSQIWEMIWSHASAAVVLLIGAAFIAGGLQLATLSGRFPVLLGAVTVALAVLEIISGIFARPSDSQKNESKSADREEIKAIAWIFLTLGVIYVFGILIGAFISTALFCRFIEKRGILKSAAISFGNVFVIWFAFSYLASFDLYRGAIF